MKILNILKYIGLSILVIAILSPIQFTLWLGFGNQFRIANTIRYKDSIPYSRSFERPFICASPNRGFLALDAEVHCTPTEWFNERYNNRYYPFFLFRLLIISAISSVIIITIYIYTKHRRKKISTA
jgi:hypothetical protein